MDNSISANLWRILWKERAFCWLKEERQYQDVDPDSCIRTLRENPAEREAAFALFEDGHTGAVRVEDIPNVAFGKLHLAGVLAICLIRPDYPTYENPSLVTILEKAIEAYTLAKPPGIDVDDPKAWGKELADKDLFGFSTILLVGIIRVELASIYVSKMRYEDALSCVSEGAWSICATTIEQTSEYSDETKRFDFHNDGFVPCLPHLGHEFNIQEAADIFEEIKRHPRGVNDWSNVKLYCEVLQYLGYRELYDLLDGIKDSTGEEFPAVEYWGKAITFAEERMQVVNSPFHILTREAQERAETEERLKRDFLSADSWRELPGEAWKILVDAEIAWTHNRPDNMTKEIRPFLEIVLPSVFVFLRPTTGERSDSRLPLTIMRDDIRGNPVVQAFIRGMKIQEQDRQWITSHLPTFLSEVIHLRNYFEKERHRERPPEKEKDMRLRAISVRRDLLGMGCEGVLPRLMKIKKATQLKEKQET